MSVGRWLPFRSDPVILIVRWVKFSNANCRLNSMNSPAESAKLIVVRPQLVPLSSLGDASRMMFAAIAIASVFVGADILLDQSRFSILGFLFFYNAFASSKLALTGKTDSPVVRFLPKGRPDASPTRT